MVKICTTRFNKVTLNENLQWRKRTNKLTHCVYGSPSELKPSIRKDEWVIVLEMHNDENEIKAISLLHNRAILTDKAHQIYKDRNYNRFIYKGPYRLVLADIQETLTPFEKKHITVPEPVLPHVKEEKSVLDGGESLTKTPEEETKKIQISAQVSEII